MIDAGGILAAGKVHAAIREWTDSPLEMAVYTHGHVDHVFAVPMFEAEGTAVRPTVVAHENVLRRFDRYQLTNGYNGWINQRQFQLPEPLFPRDFRYPDRTYRDDLDARGRRAPDRAAPRQGRDRRRHLGLDPRAVRAVHRRPVHLGGPQLRQPAEGAALPAGSGRSRCARMAALGAELMLPGHGLPIAGRERIEQVLSTAAELLESIHDQTLELMNAGATPGRPDPHGARARPPDRTAVAAAGLRRARVRRAQPLAAVRRLVRRRPVDAQARPEGRPGAWSSPGWPAVPACWPTGRWS